MKRVMKKDLMKFVFIIGIIFVFALIIKMPFLSGVDTIPPNVTSLSPSNNAQTSEHSVTFSGELNDDVGLSDAIFNLYSSDGNLYATRTANYNSTSIIFSQISAGGYFSCGVLTNGSAMCWGYNSYGNLGDGTNISKTAPTFVYGNYIFSDISTGTYHTCGILQNGSAMCWGNNEHGELGDNSTIEYSHVPIFVLGDNNFSSISSGDTYTCGILQNGTVLCWGSNSVGELGAGFGGEEMDEIKIGYPVPVYGDYNFSQISIASSNSCGLLQNGTALCWGNNNYGDLGNGSNENFISSIPVPVSGNYTFSSISVGTWYHVCGVLTNGSAMCWGYNDHGQLGNGSNGGNSFNSLPIFVSGNYTFSSISSGWSHVCGILQNGSAMCWGSNYDNELGDNDIGNEKYTPVFVLGNYNFSTITSGSSHTCGLLQNGTALCWGANTQGQLGQDSIVWRTTPYPIIGNYNFSFISGGNSHTCGVLVNGSALCWGSNYGAFGDNTNLSKKIPTPVYGNYNFSKINSAINSVCGILQNGSALCWGTNPYGQLGTNDKIIKFIPTPVYGNYTFSQIYIGAMHTCGLLQNGSAMCWGDGDFGELGDNTILDKLVPTPVYGNYTFSQIYTKGFHTCGLLQNGSALCWGYNNYGQIGDGTAIQRNIPTPIYGNYSFSSLSAGSYYTCGVLVNGSAMCWGSSYYGQLGNGSTTGNSVNPLPVLVYGNYNFSKINSAGNSVCGILQNGSALCWGINSYGQLGDGSVINKNIPTPVYGNYNFSQVFFGGSHTCGVLVNGTGLCWGYAYYGQLGDNTTSRMNIPTFVYARIIFSNTINLVDGLYYWLINVFDRIGNNYNTGNYTLTVYTSATAESPSGGSSAVTSNPVYVPSALKESFWTQTTVVMESNWEEVAQPVLTEDTQQPITEEEAISLEQELLNELKTNPDAEIQEIAIKEFSENLSVTERLKITEKNTTAYIGVARISGDSAVVQVSSGGGGGGGTVQKVMKLGETQSFDLNGDGLNDIRITLMKIDPKLRVGVKIAVIYNGLLPAKEIPEYEKEQKSNKLLILSLVVVGFLIVVTVFLRFRKFK